MCTLGFPRNVGDPVVSRLEDPEGATGLCSPRPATRVLGVVRSENRHRPVPPNEGNEVRRDGRREVGAPNSTVEAGESYPWETPWKEGGAKSWTR